MEQPSPTGGDARYSPRRPQSNPNISDRPPLREFAVVAGVVGGIGLVLYLVLGWVAEWSAGHLPWSVEQRWGELVVRALTPDPEEDSATQAELQALLDRLAAQLPPGPPPFVLHLVDQDVANAGTLPGGHILVFRGLLEEVESQNELAMILGHEIGHAVHRDPIRRLGRRLVLAAAASLLLGTDSIAGQLLAGSTDLLELRYSRDQEHRADATGLDLLHGVYGHVGGSTDFFRRLEERERGAVPWLLTHPVSGARIERLERRAQERGYDRQPTLPPGPWGDEGG